MYSRTMKSISRIREAPLAPNLKPRYRPPVVRDSRKPLPHVNPGQFCWDSDAGLPYWILTKSLATSPAVTITCRSDSVILLRSVVVPAPSICGSEHAPWSALSYQLHGFRSTSWYPTFDLDCTSGRVAVHSAKSHIDLKKRGRKLTLANQPTTKERWHKSKLTSAEQ